MATSLKLSNIQGNELELIQRIKNISKDKQYPNLKVLLSNIGNSNWPAVYEDLLITIDYFTHQGVFNYTESELDSILKMINQIDIQIVVKELMKKRIPDDIIIEPDHMQYSANGDDFLPEGSNDDPWTKNNKSDFVATGYITTSNSSGYEVEIDPSGDSARLKDESGVTDWMEIEFVQNIDDPTGDLVPVINPDGYYIPLDQVMKIDRFPGEKTYTQADFMRF